MVHDFFQINKEAILWQNIVYMCNEVQINHSCMYIYNRPVDPMETFDYLQTNPSPVPITAQLQRVKKRRSHFLVAEVGWYLSPYVPWDWGIVTYIWLKSMVIHITLTQMWPKLWNFQKFVPKVIEKWRYSEYKPQGSEGLFLNSDFLFERHTGAKGVKRFQINTAHGGKMGYVQRAFLCL